MLLLVTCIIEREGEREGKQIHLPSTHVGGAYRPVIIFHGIFSDAQNMNDLVKLIQNADPGTTVYNIDGFDGIDSMKAMNEQVDSIRQKMVPIMAKESGGVNLICFSQGVLSRIILELFVSWDIFESIKFHSFAYQP